MSSPSLFLSCALPLALLATMPAASGMEPHAAPAGPVVARPAAGVELRYEPSAPAAEAPGPGQLNVAVEAPAGRLVGRFRLDPTAQQPMERVETRLELPSSGPLQAMVLGDTQGSGGSWSRAVRIGGLRFGRPLAVRHAPASAELPPSLAAGASDYEVEAGRMRQDAAHPEGPYGPGYAAAALRTGLGRGLNAEMRGEWTPLRTAQGLELQQRVGAASALQAVVARSQTADQSGLRWGMQLLHGLAGGSWRLDLRHAERDFTPVVGDPEARTAVAAAAQLPLGRRTLADLSYAHALGQEPQSTEASLKLATRTTLARHTELGLGLALTDRPQARWAPAVSLSLSLPLASPGR